MKKKKATKKIVAFKGTKKNDVTRQAKFVCDSYSSKTTPSKYATINITFKKSLWEMCCANAKLIWITISPRVHVPRDIWITNAWASDFNPLVNKSEKKKMVNLSARNPIFHENMFFDDVLDICFKKSVFFFYHVLPHRIHRMIWTVNGIIWFLQ